MRTSAAPGDPPHLPTHHVKTAVTYMSRTGAGIGGGKERVKGLRLCPSDLDQHIGDGPAVHGSPVRAWASRERASAVNTMLRAKDWGTAVAHAKYLTISPGGTAANRYPDSVVRGHLVGVL